MADPGGGIQGVRTPPFVPRCRLFNIGPKIGPPAGPPFFAGRPNLDPPPFQKSWIRPWYCKKDWPIKSHGVDHLILGEGGLLFFFQERMFSLLYRKVCFHYTCYKRITMCTSGTKFLFGFWNYKNHLLRKNTIARTRVSKLQRSRPKL